VFMYSVWHRGSRGTGERNQFTHFMLELDADRTEAPDRSQLVYRPQTIFNVPRTLSAPPGQKGAIAGGVRLPGPQHLPVVDRVVISSDWRCHRS